MDLVVDDEAPVAGIEELEGAVFALSFARDHLVGGDGDGLDFLLFAGVFADFVFGQGGAAQELVAPLAAGDGIGDQDERGGFRLGHRSGADDGFAGAGRCADQYAVTVLYGLAALYLELIQRVWQGCGKRIQMSFSHDSPGYPCLEDIVEKAAAGRRSPTGTGAPCLLRLLLCLLYWL